MKIVFLALSALSFVTLFSCNTQEAANNQSQSPELKEDSLFASVMVVHDDVMPKMADLNRIKRNLKKWVETNETHQSVEEVKLAIAAINSAEMGMMDWMKGISAHRPETMRKAGEEHSSILNALNNELQAIEKVRDDMMNSLSRGVELQKSIGSLDDGSSQ